MPDRLQLSPARLPPTPGPCSLWHMVQRLKYSYGADPSQWGELFLPDPPAAGQLRGVVVVIHGGYWRSTYGAELGEPLAVDLAEHGMAAWNLEYRRAGNGGGWPATFQDVLAGIDKLAELAGQHSLDLGKVVAVGHSAGGHLAVWAAGRGHLAGPGPGAELADPGGVRLAGVVSQSGVLNLAEAERLNLSNGAAANLLGGSSSEFPRRYRCADPMGALPLDVPVYAVHAEADDDVPLAMSALYVDASGAGGVPAHLVMVPGDHFDLINPKSPAYAVCRELAARLLG
ncbi:acetyl esterase/lipase [Arthrobacter sp. AG258]|nr:acetyl esterase/lipase [Arthrobacter sp. AG258]